MDFIISRETSNLFFEVGLADRRRESIDSERHPHFTSALFFHPDIGEARGIVSHEYHCEHRSIARRTIGNLIFDIFEDGRGDDASVEEGGHWFIRFIRFVRFLR